MQYDTRLWNFVQDMNSDGNINITDITLWVKWLFFYPGDVIIRLLIRKVPNVAIFLEVSFNNYGGIMSGVLSFIIWAFILVSMIRLFYCIDEWFSKLKEYIRRKRL